MTSDYLLRVLVVDDTVVYRKIVSDVIADIPNVEIVGTAHNGKAAIAKIHSLKPDLLTLDIEMPDGTGFDLLQKFGNYDFQVIFITAFNHYAITAIKLGSSGFCVGNARPM